MEHRAFNQHWQTFAAHLLADRSATDAYLLAGYRNTTLASA